MPAPLSDIITLVCVIFCGSAKPTLQWLKEKAHPLVVRREAVLKALTGGKGSITQWIHAEYMEGSETIRPTFTQQVRGGYFSKVPTKVPTG